MKTFAAIDVGSYELAMKIFEISAKSGIRAIDHIRHRIDLGTDTYANGKISNERVDELCRVLRDYGEIMKGYRVDAYKAYGTSAIREMDNRMILLDQIAQRTGITIECISNSEQRFLDYKSIASKGDVFNRIIEKGTAIVDIGGGTSEVAVISLGGIVTSRSVRVAGDAFDTAIINYIKKKYNLLIGERTAENVKIAIGSAFPMEQESDMEIKGRNLLNGLPENINVTSAEIREALAEPLSHVVEAIKVTLEKTPPELAADIIDQGITLAGGGALIRGLDKLINKETGMPVKTPLDCVADGTGKVLEDIERLREVLNDDSKYY